MNKPSVLLAVLSGVFYCLPFLFPYFFVISWFSFVPLLCAIRNKNNLQIYLLGVVSGFVAYTLSMQWLVNLAQLYLNLVFPLNYVFLFLFALVGGNFFGLFLLLYRWLKKNTPISDLLLFPSCFVFVFLFNFMLFNTSFGVSQVKFYAVLQGIEFIGIQGLTWLLALCNIFLFKLIFERAELKKIAVVLVIALIAGWLVWGFYAANKWKTIYSKWETKKIAIVQPNRVSSFSENIFTEFASENPIELDLIDEIAFNNPELIIWPEGYIYNYQRYPKIQEKFRKKISSLNTNLLFIDIYYKLNKHYNSMFWLNNSGNLADVYHKRSLVPFGEYLPFQKYYTWLLKLINYPFSRFAAGDTPKIFNIAGMKIAPLICYESIIAKTAAQSVAQQGQGKIFVVATNNGWYRSYFQVQGHSNISVVRAVENRIPLIHAINNGYSSVSMPDGKVIFKTPYLKTGAWFFELPFNQNFGGSFYSKHYGWFENLIKIFVGSLIIFCLIKNSRCFYKKK